ncbi:MAG: M48 family metallopeptidase [Magnetospirillum sp.]
MAGLEDLQIEADGRQVPVIVRRSPLARRMSLRVDAVRGIVLVLPMRGRLADARTFLLSHGEWLRQRLGKLPDRQNLGVGRHIPLLGVPHLVRHRPDARRGVWVENAEIHVSGQEEHASRRVGDFLRAQARRVMVDKVHTMAARLDRKVSRVTVKDTVSRWGSCSSQGAIALSWRLVMAPPFVLDYVVGHEVAHLVELNHSPAFWDIVRSLGVDHHGGRNWLKAHGASLHHYRP